MRLYTAPEPVTPQPNTHVVFLAGSIEQGAARNWQQDVITAVGHLDCIVLNPRRAAWDATWEQTANNPLFLEQVTWELDGLEMSSIAFFYFQGSTMSPITLAELGKALELYAAGIISAVIVVCEPSFWRYGNVDIMCMREGIDVHKL